MSRAGGDFDIVLGFWCGGGEGGRKSMHWMVKGEGCRIMIIILFTLFDVLSEVSCVYS